jgi:hypothetical protein
LTGGTNLKNGRETGGKTKIPPVPQPLCTKAFRAKKGGREGHFDVRHKNKIKVSDVYNLVIYNGTRRNEGTKILFGETSV